jgi:Transposase zinc-binding domain/Putative transposase
MIALSDVIARFEADYLAHHQPLPSQLQALSAFKRCRTRLAATYTAQCSNPQCQAQRVVPHSCGHRHCPHCQHLDSQRWIARQQQQLVPGPYFFITFTLPAELRLLAWQHQRAVYAALMDCAWQTLREFSQNHRQLRGCPGAVAVLHTHSRALDFHPHVHLAMPAAALDSRRRLWRRLPLEQGYLFNHKALAKVFRGKLLDQLKAHGLPPPVVLPERWVVHCKRLDHGRAAMVYLGRYLYRGVIQEHDILRCDDAGVTYRWRDSKTGQLQQRTVGGAQFLRLVLQHVLPKGFRRARSFCLPAPQRQAHGRAAAIAGVRHPATGATAHPAATHALRLLRRTHAHHPASRAAIAGGAVGSDAA